MQNEPVEKIIRQSKSGQKVTCQLAPILCVPFFGFIRSYTIKKKLKKSPLYYQAKNCPFFAQNKKIQIF